MSAVPELTHYVNTVPGIITGDGWARLADDLRTVGESLDIRHKAGRVECAIHERDGELGELRVAIHSERESTRIAVWSTAPHLGPAKTAACGALGIFAAILPVVATAGGHWPVLSALGVLAGIGFAVGTGVALVWQRWATRRWRAQLASLLTPIVARVTSLAAENRSAS